MMDVNKQNWELWLERLYNLRRDKRGSHERPHKPILLLSIIDLLDRGLLTQNKIPLSSELERTFRRYFKIVRKQNDRATIENPYYFLSGDKFWHLIPAKGQAQLYVPGSVSGAPSVTALRSRVSHAQFDVGLWELLSDFDHRRQLREAIFARYFPDEREKLAALADVRLSQGQPEVRHEELPPGRDSAFRRIILNVYDYRCAACGIRVVLEQRKSLVEAAHLIPFNVSRNDMPTNGVALCPNHHWAMDHSLIAPCPDDRRRAGVWRVNHNRLDDRIEGQRELVAIESKPVIPPSEEKFYPALESLRWRKEHLNT